MQLPYCSTACVKPDPTLVPWLQADSRLAGGGGIPSYRQHGWTSPHKPTAQAAADNKYQLGRVLPEHGTTLP
jgi:hypothetical protein